MIEQRIKTLRSFLEHPLLIKKKENLLYLTGRSFMQGYLLVKSRKHTDGNANRRGKPSVVFFGDGLEKVEGIKTDRLKNAPLYLNKAATLELEDEFTFAEYNYIRQKIKDSRLKIKVVHVKSPVDRQRAIKDGGEIRLIKKSMQIVERVFGLVRKEIKKTGITEGGLAEFIKQAGFRFGAEDVSFPPIVASGANAAVPHHVPSNKRLKAGESIILDFGFKYKNYCSDFTRTVFLKKADPKLAAAYNQVEKAYWGSMDLIDSRTGSGPLPGGEQVYRKAVDILAEKHLDKYFIHSLGHGTGLEIHELPNLSPHSKEVLQNGMVFSIEPGVYLPKKGGIRIEDLVYLEKGKVKRFIAVPTALIDNVI